MGTLAACADGLAACADGLAACADLAVDVSGTLAPAAFVLDAALDLPKRLTRWILYRLRNSLTCSLVRLQCALCACKRPSGLEKKKKSSCVSQRLFRLFSAFPSVPTRSSSWTKGSAICTARKACASSTSDGTSILPEKKNAVVHFSTVWLPAMSEVEEVRTEAALTSVLVWVGECVGERGGETGGGSLASLFYVALFCRLANKHSATVLSSFSILPIERLPEKKKI